MAVQSNPEFRSQFVKICHESFRRQRLKLGRLSQSMRTSSSVFLADAKLQSRDQSSTQCPNGVFHESATPGREWQDHGEVCERIFSFCFPMASNCIFVRLN